MNHYSFQGEQIDLNKFIFNEEMVRLRQKYACYIINEKKSGKEYIAYVSRFPISKVSTTFSEELSIRHSIEYPSILSLKGYNESNFDYYPYPVLIFEYCRHGTLSDVLSLEKEGKLAEKGYKKWNNTKKMINLIGIAFAMNHLHSKNIIHRNLKCENVFLDDDLYPKI